MKNKLYLIGALLTSVCFGVAGCNQSSSVTIVNGYTLPEIHNLTTSEAKLLLGANIYIDPIEVQTSELIEGRILGYRNNNVGDVVEKGSRIAVNVAARLDKSIALSDSNIVNYITELDRITGRDSTNEELCTNAGQGGTDLGIPFELPDGRTMLLYGDTFSSAPMSGFWNSNFMAITSDEDLTDGLQFDELVTNDANGMILPFAQGAHQGGNETDKSVEVTKIPTGGISIGNDVYIFYMSIRYWGVGGDWRVTYNQCLKADDLTYKSWSNVESLRWDEDELYYAGQIYPFNDPKDDEHIYFTSIPGGRNNGAVMFRVDKDKFENRDEYEYLTSKNTWTKGDDGMKKLNDNPYFIMSPGVSEPSIVYSEYLDKYVFATLKGSNIVFGVSDNVCGPYNETYPVVSSSDFPGLYGGFVHSKFMDSDGQRMYIQLSRWTPIYNTYLVEVVLK